MLSLVVPVFNRLENLKLCLEGIKYQKDPGEFEIIIVDDGSTDGLKDWFDATYGEASTYKNHFSLAINQTALGPISLGVPIRYFSGGPNKGFRGGRARNIGSFNAGGDRFVFIDSDIVLNENAIASYQYAHSKNPGAVIVGRYFVLPGIRWTDEALAKLRTATDFDLLVEDLSRQKVEIDWQPDGQLWQWGHDLGMRPEGDYTDDPMKTTKGSGLGGLSGNISYPRDLFWKLGGFDERIVGHGGEDADLGLTADEAQTDWLFYKPIFGWHLWHSRNQEQNAKDVQANIAFIDAKHGVGKYRDAKKYTDSQDWRDPAHYHKHLNAIVVKEDDDPTVYAVREGKGLGISSPKWLADLGFQPKDIIIVPKGYLSENVKVMGATPEST